MEEHISALHTEGWIFEVGDVFSNGIYPYHLKVIKIERSGKCADDCIIHVEVVDPQDHNKPYYDEVFTEWHRVWYMNENWYK